MKKSLMMALLCLTSMLKAQPILQICNTPPTLGRYTDTLYSYQNSNVSNGIVGANVSWNYSMITLDTTYLISHFVTTANNSPYQGFFPNAQFSDSTSSGEYSYYSYSNDSSTYWGYYSSNNNCLKLQNPQKFEVCPLNYNGIFRDTYQGISCGSNFPTFGNSKTTYDGYGTLILPGTTYSNTIRLHTLDSINDDNKLIYADSYIWIDVALKKTVFKISHITFPGFSFTYTDVSSIKYASIQPNASNEIKELEIKVYPNPFSNELTVESLTPFKNATIYLENSFGQIVKEIQGINDSKLVIERDHLPQGIYFLKIFEDQKSTKIQKLMIQN